MKDTCASLMCILFANKVRNSGLLGPKKMCSQKCAINRPPATKLARFDAPEPRLSCGKFSQSQTTESYPTTSASHLSTQRQKIKQIVDAYND